MHNKKKLTGVRRPTAKKKVHKVSQEASETIATTKEKTFATIEQTNQGNDHKTSTRTTHFTSRRENKDRFEDNNLSPFSNPRHSASPLPHSSLSPNVVKQKQRKALSKAIVTQTQCLQKREAVQTHSKASGHCMVPGYIRATGQEISLAASNSKGTKTPKIKDKNTKRAKAEFQNEFIKRMSRMDMLKQRKITEVSEEEMEGSLKKNKRNLLVMEPRKQERKKSKKDIVRQMHKKIKQKYLMMYPNLAYSEIKILSALVLVQRLWRQHKVKHMIGKFLASPPPLAQQCLITASPTPSHQVARLHTPEPLKQGTLHTTPVSESLNLEDLELSDEFSSPSSSKAGSIRRYVHMYRQLTLMSKKKKKQAHRSKPNAFNFPCSLSDKCLLEKLYRKSLSSHQKIESQGMSTSNQLFLFPKKTSDKLQEQYMSPKKPETVQLEERFYTEARDEEFTQADPLQSVKPEQHTVSSIGQTAQAIISKIITEFSEEFFAFGQRKCLKRKRRLPGIPINESTISIYLEKYLQFVGQNYSHQMGLSISAVAAPSYLKIFRPAPDENLFQSGSVCLSNSSEDREEEFDRPVLPHSAFFEYQSLYEQQFFQIKQQDSKYTNFLLGLIKIHNKCLADCLSELIEKSRIDSIQLPWDTCCPVTRLGDANKSSTKRICAEIKQVKQRILKISGTRLGRLTQRDPECEEMSLLVSCKDDYQREGKDWDDYAEFLEVRLELTEALLQTLYREAVQDIWDS